MHFLWDPNPKTLLLMWVKVGHSETRNVEKMTLMDTLVVGCIEFLYFVFIKIKKSLWP
jgi:hypothetical protein